MPEARLKDYFNISYHMNALSSVAASYNNPRTKYFCCIVKVLGGIKGHGEQSNICMSVFDRFG